MRSSCLRHNILTTVLLLAAFSSTAFSAEPNHASLRNARISDVRFEDAFWTQRIETCRRVTIPHGYLMCETTGRIDNFVKAAGAMPGEFEGAHFNDSDVYKIVEAATWVLGSRSDPDLERITDEVIAKIAAAQQPDGYLDTFFTIDRRDERFQHIHPDARHELYCMGHLIEAGATHFEQTGRRTLLDVACKLADHIEANFGPGKRGEVPEHQEIELALLKLHRVTGETRYRDLAAFFIDARGNPDTHELFGPYCQDHEPVRRQSEIVGHAVRAMYHCIGMADLYAETGDAELRDALGRLWQSTTRRKMYLTGGIGATRHGEAFGADYQLPNQTAYSETCAQIGLLLFAHRMSLLEPNAEYADVIERVLYNGFLSGVGLSGDRFFYVNPLASSGNHHRREWYGCACCPSNVVRIFPQLGRFMYATAEDSIRVNLYASSTAELDVAGGSVSIAQETRYPWDGHVKIVVTPRQDSLRFSLCPRIPGWCRDQQTPGGLYHWQPGGTALRNEGRGSQRETPTPTITINGQPVDITELDNGYARLTRDWKPGDTVDMHLPMPIRRVHAHPSVSADVGRVALQRGPIVYCVEAVDLDGNDPRQLILPPAAELSAGHRDDLLGGVTVITGKALAMRGDKESPLPVELTAVPYHAWDHRQAGAMAVWLIEDPTLIGPTRSAEWVGSNYTPAYCVNQVQMWHDFQPEVIDRELAAAKRYFGITTLRVYLHNLPHEAEKERFLANIEQFLVVCQRHGIRPGFTFFDDCHRHEGIELEEPTEPVKGYHNGRWAACPQDRHRTVEHLPKLEAYVQDVIAAHRDDSRVLWWEIFNEPHRGNEFSANLRKLGYAWAKEIKPTQPVLCCWDDSPETDLVDAHNYTGNFDTWARQLEINPDKGCVFTEAGARWHAPRHSNGEPCEVIHWLAKRKREGLYTPGVYLCWELMVGNSNCRWYWGTPEGSPEPSVPWCGLMWPDATPVSLAEAEAVRRYTTGQSRALFFDDFQTNPPPKRVGWSTHGGATSNSRVLRLEPGMKMLAGESTWGDYVLEGVVMLHGENGNAGLVFRANDPGPRSDQLRGYYVGLDTKTLHLGKHQNNWQPLAEFDLTTLDCKIVPDTWNHLRVAVEGPRVRVWCNRMHPSSDPDAGLRIDFTDPTAPILAGAIGVRTHNVAASFDNIIVLPEP